MNCNGIFSCSTFDQSFSWRRLSTPIRQVIALTKDVRLEQLARRIRGVSVSSLLAELDSSSVVSISAVPGSREVLPMRVRDLRALSASHQSENRMARTVLLRLSSLLLL